MDRRNFLAASTASVIVSSTIKPVFGSTGPMQSREVPVPCADHLNPPGIRTAGIRMLPVVDCKYKVWTKRIGSGPLKVLLLHGGPGFSHDYLEAMESFLPEAGITLHYYDQLGCGNSDHPDDSSLWRVPRYVEEVEEVRRGLNLEHFVLFGHSWGGMLAIDYALNYQQHLRGLVISNMTAGMKAYVKRTSALKLQLAPGSLARLQAIEAKGDCDSPEYDKIMMEELYPKVLCRTKPWPEPVGRAFRVANLKIYNQMQGKSEFLVTGNMKDWERWDRLHEIKVNTLTIGAEYDEMDPDDMRKMASLMPHARSVICPNGSHLCMWDDQAFYFRHLLEFLHSI